MARGKNVTTPAEGYAHNRSVCFHGPQKIILSDFSDLLTSLLLLSMKFRTDISGSQKINPDHFGGDLAFEQQIEYFFYHVKCFHVYWMDWLKV